MTRKEWLDALKPGDVVANKIYLNLVWERYSYSYTYETHTVKAITKSGKIKLDNGVTLSKKGQLAEYTGLGANAFYCIEPFTYEIGKHIIDVENYVNIRQRLLKDLDDLYENISTGKIGLDALSDLDYQLSEFRMYNK